MRAAAGKPERRAIFDRVRLGCGVIRSDAPPAPRTVSPHTLARAAVAVRDLDATWSRRDVRGPTRGLRARTLWLTVVDELYPTIRSAGLAIDDDPRRAVATAAVLTTASVHEGDQSVLEDEVAAVLQRTWRCTPGPASGTRRGARGPLRRGAGEGRARPLAEMSEEVAAGMAGRVRRRDPGLSPLRVALRVHAALEVVTLLGDRGGPWVDAALDVEP